MSKNKNSKVELTEYRLRSAHSEREIVNGKMALHHYKPGNSIELTDKRAKSPLFRNKLTPIVKTVIDTTAGDEHLENAKKEAKKNIHSDEVNTTDDKDSEVEEVEKKKAGRPPKSS